MKIHTFVSGIIQKGRRVLQAFGNCNAHNSGVKVAEVAKQAVRTPVVCYRHPFAKDKLQSILQRLIPNVYFTGLASQIGRQVAIKGMKKTPLLAFVGLVVATNVDQEEDVIVSKIRDFVKVAETGCSPFLQQIQQLSLDKFEFGQVIGQGCSTVVCEAQFKPNNDKKEQCMSQTDNSFTNSTSRSGTNTFVETVMPVTSPLPKVTSPLPDVNETADLHIPDNFSEASSDITILSLEEDFDDAPREFCNADVLDWDSCSDSDISILSFSSDQDMTSSLMESCCAPQVFFVSTQTALDNDSDDDVLVLSSSEKSLEDGSDIDNENQIIWPLFMISKIYENENTNINSCKECEFSQHEIPMYISKSSDESIGVVPKFDLAIKMMFKLDIESNEEAILHRMENEAVPSRLAQTNLQLDNWQNGNRVRKKGLPAHANIVEMWGLFVDSTPQLPDCVSKYQGFWSPRMNLTKVDQSGTVFLVMKKYSANLTEYLSIVNLTMTEQLGLLAQLLEAVAHMQKNGIAHRNINGDSILLDTSLDGLPCLVVSDFGRCLADEEFGFQLPFTSDKIDRGGNTAMAPEIAGAEPGWYSMLDYQKADLWATGAMAYDIFGVGNPFYSHCGSGLDSRSYKDSDLPSLPDYVPKIIKKLVGDILSHDLRKRPTPREAADILQVFLWAPADWLLSGNVSRSEVTWWLLNMATEVHMSREVSSELNLKKCFLEDFNFNRFYGALNYCSLNV